MLGDRKALNVAAAKNTPDADTEAAEYEMRRAIRQAEAWMPEPGAKTKGEVIGLRMGGDPEPIGFGYYPVIIYRNLLDSGSYFAVHAFHTTLRERMAELKTDIGSTQWLSYQGQKESRTRKDSEGKPQKYYLYDVENVGEELTAKEEGFTF
jgi:hypothetical protein